MVKIKRWLSLMLSFVMVFIACMPAGGMQQVHAEGDVEITDLMVDRVTDPIGIDNQTPRFSWKMRSNATGQYQKAYQIVVTEWNELTGALGAVVWDSGRVEGSQAVDIPYDGAAALKSSKTYYWDVTVWDKNDNDYKSQPARFEMGLLEADAFDGVNWIRMPKKGDPDPEAPEPEVDKSIYTIDLKAKFKDALGLIFAAEDNSHFYMWQINNNMENGVDGTWIRPHVWNGGGAMYNPEGLSDYKGYQLDEELESDTEYLFSFKIDTTTNTVTTYVDGEVVNSLVCPNADFTYGRIGFRQAANYQQGFAETIWIDEMKATANDGTVLFYQDFELASDSQMDAGTVEDGNFYIEGIEPHIIALSKESSLYYRFDTDFTINSGKAGIVYGGDADGSEYYYTQVNPQFEAGNAVVQHQRRNGVNSKFDQGLIENVTSADMIGQKHRFTLTSTSSKEVRGYIDGVEAKYHDRLAEFIFDGKIGFNSDGGDDVLYDNTIVKIKGTPKFYADYEGSENPLSAGTLEDNGIRISGNQVALMQGSLGAADGSEEEPEAVNYDIDVDLNISGGAAGIVFSAKDSANMFMWQLNGGNNGKLYIRPHIWANNTPHYAAYETDISEYFDYETEIKNQDIHVKLKVTNDTIETYIEGTPVHTFTIDDATPGQLIDGRVGFRSGEASEIFSADNLVVTTYDEEENATVKFSYDFDDGIYPFAGSAGQANSSKIKDGRLFVPGNGGVLMTKDFASLGMPMFRKTFTPESQQIASAKVYASALGTYDLYVNGQRVGYKDQEGNQFYDEMKPGWTDYHKRVFYYTHDITDLIVSGDENAILATVGTGWWTGRVSYGTYANKDMAFLAKIVITYADGTQKVIKTDDTWKTSKQGVIREADIWDGETYDANYPGPDEVSIPGFPEDESWSTVRYSEDFGGVLSAQVGQTIQVRPEMEQPAKKITVYQGAVDNGSDHGEINVIKDDYSPTDEIHLERGQTLLYNFGQNMVGWPYMEVEAPQGTEIKFNFAEMLNDSGKESRGNDGPQGSLYMANYRSALSTGTYIAAGKGTESYRPAFSFYGYQYMAVTANQDITIKKMTSEVLGSAVPEISSLTTSDESVNQLISNILWGQRGNYLSVPTDCPQRDERLGWSGDTQVFVGAAAYNGDVAGFFHKWALDAMDSQYATGEYTDVIPRSNAVGAGNAAWGDAGIIVPYTMYKMYGDTQIIHTMYESMEKYMNWLESRGYAGPGIAYGDWLAYESNSNEVKSLIACAYYAYDALLMAEMSEAIGESAKATAYTNRYEEIKDYFQAQFMNADKSMKSQYTTQTCYLMALRSDMYDTAAEKQKAVDTLVRNIKANGNKLGTGFVGTGTLNQTLSDVGATDMAYTLLLQRDNPSWLYSVDQGATTIWERWNSYTIENGFGDVSMNSFNHYSYGAVLEWMYSDMLGIEADAGDPGFKHFIYQPKPDTRAAEDIPANQKRMTEVSGSYDSAYGKIDAAWQLGDTETTYQLTVPANSGATVQIPLQEGYEITVNDKNTDDLDKDADGIEYIETKDGNAIFEAVAGTYEFVAEHETLIPPVTFESVTAEADNTELSWDEIAQIGNVTAIGSDGAAMDMENAVISYRSDNTAVATVNTRGVVTARNAGEAKVTVTVVLDGVKKSTDITFNVSEIPPVDPVLDEATAVSIKLVPVDGYEYAIQAKDEQLSFSSDYEFFGLKASTKYKLYQRIAETDLHSAGTASAALEVTTKKADSPKPNPPAAVAVTEVKLNKTSLKLKEGQSEKLTASILPQNATNKSIRWSSSNTEVATVDANGQIKALLEGKATITVVAHNGKKATCQITVEAEKDNSTVSLSAKKLTLGKGEKATLKATVKNAKKSVKPTWKSSNSKVVSVSSKGALKAKKTGKATITAKLPNGKQAKCTITVKKAPSSVKLNAKSKTLKKGKTYKLKAKLSKGSAGKVTWSSSNKKVVKVDTKGKLKALKKGKATITAKTYNGKKARIKITVK